MSTDLLAFNQQQQAASMARKEGKLAQQAEDVAATQRESDRKARLADAISTQVAMSGARGVSAFEGSPLSVMRESRRREALATDRDRFNAKIAGLSARYRSEATAGQIRGQAAVGLLKSAEDAAKTAASGGAA